MAAFVYLCASVSFTIIFQIHTELFLVKFLLLSDIFCVMSVYDRI